MADGPTPASASDGAASFDAHKASQELLQEVRELLRADVELDEGQRELFGAHFAQALQAVVEQQGQAAETVDRTLWRQALSDLEVDGDVSPTDAADLSRRVEGALLPLERRPTQVALEFSRRMQEEGSEKALAWLREQRAGSDESTVSAPMVPSSSAPAVVGGDDVTKSRSRRLRGPPTGV